jgi:hypothetical protein
MSYSIIATLAELTRHMDTHVPPSPGLAKRAARLAADDTGRTHLRHLAARQPEASAQLWSQIADLLCGTAQLNARAVATQCTHTADHPTATTTTPDKLGRLNANTATQPHRGR